MVSWAWTRGPCRHRPVLVLREATVVMLTSCKSTLFEPSVAVLRPLSLFEFHIVKRICSELFARFCLAPCFFRKLRLNLRKFSLQAHPHGRSIPHKMHVQGSGRIDCFFRALAMAGYPHVERRISARLPTQRHLVCHSRGSPMPAHG